jgi:thiol-disulfide isomerase/thioredoxin
MHILHINSEKNVNQIDKHIKKGNNVFILVYMEGCGPCNATRPEWAKLESALQDQYATNDKLVVIDVNKDYLSSVNNLGPIDGFPTMKYAGNYGQIIENYENSPIKTKDRTIDSFINWIENKINTVISTTPTNSAKNVYYRLAHTKKHRKRHKSHHKKRHSMRGGKWSRKYKLSINCKKPKGFSQKQYCKYK